MSFQVHHRCSQLMELGLLPKFAEDFSNIISQSYFGDVTIVPTLEAQDYAKYVVAISHHRHHAQVTPSVVSNPTMESIARGVFVGQQAAWRKLAMIQNHCRIEIALDDIVCRLQVCPPDAALYLVM